MGSTRRPNAEYACLYADAGAPDAGAVVMCRACVPSAYFVTRADYSNAHGHSNLHGQALKKEEAHFALVSKSVDYESCEPSRAEYCELCVSQVAALCPIAILWVVEATSGATTTAATYALEPQQNWRTAPNAQQAIECSVPTREGAR